MDYSHSSDEPKLTDAQRSIAARNFYAAATATGLMLAVLTAWLVLHRPGANPTTAAASRPRLAAGQTDSSTVVQQLRRSGRIYRYSNRQLRELADWDRDRGLGGAAGSADRTAPGLSAQPLSTDTTNWNRPWLGSWQGTAATRATTSTPEWLKSLADLRRAKPGHPLAATDVALTASAAAYGGAGSATLATTDHSLEVAVAAGVPTAPNNPDSGLLAATLSVRAQSPSLATCTGCVALNAPSNPLPEPGTLWLTLLAALGLAAFARRCDATPH